MVDLTKGNEMADRTAIIEMTTNNSMMVNALFFMGGCFEIRVGRVAVNLPR